MSRGPTNPKVAELVALFGKAIDSLNPRVAIGGAIAMIPHGVRRETTDLDVFAYEEDRGSVLNALRSVGLETAPVMPPIHYVAWLPEHGDPDVKIDVLFPAAEPDLTGIDTAEVQSLGGVKVRVMRGEFLAAMKLYRNTLQDRADIARLLEMGAFEAQTVRYIYRSIDPEMLEPFEELLQEIQRHRPRTRPKRKKT